MNKLIQKIKCSFGRHNLTSKTKLIVKYNDEERKVQIENTLYEIGPEAKMSQITSDCNFCLQQFITYKISG